MGEASCLLWGMQRGRSPLAKPASAMRWRDGNGWPEGQTYYITWLASLPDRMLRLIPDSGQAQSFRPLPPRRGTPRHWLQPMLKCALPKTAGRSARIRSNVAAAKGGQPGAGLRRPAVMVRKVVDPSQKDDGACLRTPVVT